MPGLGELMSHDSPQLAIWPFQLSTLGFTNSFHRCTPTGERELEPSKWVFMAGRAMGGKQSLFVGLALWSETKNTIGRINVEPNQWLTILRLMNKGGA
jgi:hypothetical protein